VAPIFSRVMFVVIALMAATAYANSLEKLLMPGELTIAHADLESDCSQCHDRSDRSRQRALCLGCHDHENIVADIQKGEGFHGRAAGQGECNACHSEHKGRSADIIRLDSGSFNHRRTDLALTGAHVSAACDACHKKGRKYREAPRQCVDCHREVDSHRGKLGTDCAQCHETTAFKQAKFDHARTRFPLTDAHSNVACAACHRDPAYKDTPMGCVDCHAADDVHRSSRGGDCTSCHNMVDWKQSRFDHARVAKYSLEGKHATITCNACHRGGDLKAPVPKECNGCHAAADRHSGRFGIACKDCHSQLEWPTRDYDHVAHTESRFELRGAHEKLDCHACHTGVLKQQQMAKDCYGCHASDDAHAGSMGKECQSCHKESGWQDDVRFDHDLARFPLVGLHVNVPCEECHASRAYRDAPSDCMACHQAKDVHENRLGERCESCHNANGWAFWQFDHSKQAEFALVGAHLRLGCRDCHREVAQDMALPKECSSCHLRDDIHDGRFGRDCGRCHSADSFHQASMN
jgi:hypothetical protein